MKTIIFNQVEMDLTQAKKKAVDMHENMLECLECGLIDDAHALHTELTYLEDLIINAESSEKVKPTKRELIQMLNNGIRYAIKSIETQGRGITPKRIDNILRAYKTVTGVEMSELQVKYLRTLSDEQARRVIYTINAFIKEVA